MHLGVVKQDGLRAAHGSGKWEVDQLKRGRPGPKGIDIDSRIAAIEGNGEGLSTGCIVLERIKFLPSAPAR